MYCSTCGGEVAPGSSYCIIVAAGPNAPEADNSLRHSELFPDSLIWAIVSVFIVGFGGTHRSDGGDERCARALDRGQILRLASFCLVAMMVVEAVSIYMRLVA